MTRTTSCCSCTRYERGAQIRKESEVIHSAEIIRGEGGCEGQARRGQGIGRDHPVTTQFLPWIALNQALLSPHSSGPPRCLQRRRSEPPSTPSRNPKPLLPSPFVRGRGGGLYPPPTPTPHRPLWGIPLLSSCALPVLGIPSAKDSFSLFSAPVALHAPPGHPFSPRLQSGLSRDELNRTQVRRSPCGERCYLCISR